MKQEVSAGGPRRNTRPRKAEPPPPEPEVSAQKRDSVMTRSKERKSAAGGLSSGADSHVEARAQELWVRQSTRPCVLENFKLHVQLKPDRAAQQSHHPGHWFLDKREGPSRRI